MRFLLVILGIIAFAVDAECKEFRGPTINVLDGDTFDMNSGQTKVRIRLCGIDAPEGKQQGGAASTLALKNLIDGKANRIPGVSTAIPIMVFH